MAPFITSKTKSFIIGTLFLPLNLYAQDIRELDLETNLEKLLPIRKTRLDSYQKSQQEFLSISHLPLPDKNGVWNLSNQKLEKGHIRRIRISKIPQHITELDLSNNNLTVPFMLKASSTTFPILLA